MAGNRTRVDCLEGNHANLYTTIAYNTFKKAWLNNYVVWFKDSVRFIRRCHGFTISFQ